MRSRGSRWRAAAVVWALCVLLGGAAHAQMGGGGIGSGGGGGGGGGAGSGRSGSNKPKEPPKKRHEQTQPDPASSREKLAEALKRPLGGGTGSPAFLANLFDRASTGALPASTASRKALADAVAAPLKGVKLTPEQADAIAQELAAGVNADGLTAEDLPAKKTALQEALVGANVPDDATTAILLAFDKVVADQQDESIKKIAELMDAMQADGNVNDDQRKQLAEAIMALATGETKPSEDSVTKLAERLGKALDKAQLLNKEQAEIAHEIRAIVNSAGLPVKDFQASLNDVKSTLKAGVVPQADIQSVAQQLQAIHTELNGRK